MLQSAVMYYDIMFYGTLSFALKNDPLDEPIQPNQQFLSLNNDGQKRKMVVKIEFTPLSHCNILQGYKKYVYSDIYL